MMDIQCGKPSSQCADPASCTHIARSSNDTPCDSSRQRVPTPKQSIQGRSCRACQHDKTVVAHINSCKPASGHSRLHTRTLPTSLNFNRDFARWAISRTGQDFRAFCGKYALSSATLMTHSPFLDGVVMLWIGHVDAKRVNNAPSRNDPVGQRRMYRKATKPAHVCIDSQRSDRSGAVPVRSYQCRSTMPA